MEDRTVPQSTQATMRVNTFPGTNRRDTINAHLLLAVCLCQTRDAHDDDIRVVRRTEAQSLHPCAQDFLQPSPIFTTVAVGNKTRVCVTSVIKYVLSPPGDRARDIEALLQLTRVEELRASLQKNANALDKQLYPLKQGKLRAIEQLKQGAEISDLSETTFLAAINKRRSILELNSIDKLTPTTSLKEGLVGTSAKLTSRVPKKQALQEIGRFKDCINKFSDPESKAVQVSGISKLEALNRDPRFTEVTSREQFLRLSLQLIEDDKCPLCDTPWNIRDLRALIQNKLEGFDIYATKRTEVTTLLDPLISSLDEPQELLESIERYVKLLNPPIDTTRLREFKSGLAANQKQVRALLPLSSSITILKTTFSLPGDVGKLVDSIETAIQQIPDPTEQDSARDYLSVVQERYEAYRAVSLNLKKTEEQAALSREVYNLYAKISTQTLDQIYKGVQGHFSTLYRSVNHEDEDKFQAKLEPSIGKLAFDVDFYGRGFFPPGAYHSEGHQDGMGLCLYLALMKHLMGDAFTFTVLDDVLMSIDAGHRREVCNMLREYFPDTQFILTTHDPIWLKHMRTVGLISPGGFIQFRTWTVNTGPTVWDDRDIWNEIQEAIDLNNIREAASLLRHYLEYTATEVSHRLRARIEFRADSIYMLGDLFPPAVKSFSELLLRGEEAALSWGKKEEAGTIQRRRLEFGEAVKLSNIEQWQINPAVHYNEWANFQKADFEPAASILRTLVDKFFCPECNAIYYVTPERGGPPENLRCFCGPGINLLKKK